MLRRPVFDIIHPTLLKSSRRERSPSLQRAVASIELALHHGDHINGRLSRALYLDDPAQHAADTELHKKWRRPETLLESRTLKLRPLLDDQTTALLAALEDVAVHFRIAAALGRFQESMGAFGAPEDRDATMHWDIVSDQVGVDVRPGTSPVTLLRLERIRSLACELRAEARQLASDEELKALVVAGSPVLLRDHQRAREKAVRHVAAAAAPPPTSDAAQRKGAGPSLWRTLLSLYGPGAMDDGKTGADDGVGLQQAESVSLRYFPNREVSVVYEQKNQEAIVRAQQRIQ
jgi:hypothetical protein